MGACCTIAFLLFGVWLLDRRIEALLFSRDEALSLSLLADVLLCSEDEVRDGLLVLEKRLENSALCLQEVASGWRLLLREDYVKDVMCLAKAKPQRFSKAFWETLAYIAYHQPVTRAEVATVRGVESASTIYKQLFDLDWVRVAGFKDTPGRPELLATTRRFLDDFSLRSLEDLPSLDFSEMV